MGVAMLLTYLAGGYLCAHVVLWDKSLLLRAWLGLSFGWLMFLWLPALAAFFVRFTMTGQIIAWVAMVAITLAAALFRRKHPRSVRALAQEDRGMLWALVCFVLPMTLLSAYLQHTHTIRPVDGRLHVGQSTYGDLSMHLSIATSLVDSALPADYNILPGTTLGYPLLTDATGTSLLIWGMPLRWALIVPGILMSLLVYGGYLLLAKEMTGRTSVAVLAGVLLFFNGGLGFVYDIDMSGSSLAKISEIFTGYYKTPANQPAFNLRWSNLVADLLLPQRTFLGGWSVLLPALYFAREAFQKGDKRMYLLVALFGGGLPLVHTHSFLALGVYSAGALGYTLWTERDRRETLTGAGLYLGIVLVLAVPQLVAFTLRQATSEGFVRLHFNWVNNTANGFVDFYPWFWLKNVGLPLIPMLCVLINWRRKDRMDLIGALLVFLVAELVLFQPLDYDNNKVFYVWYLLMLPSAAAWCMELWHRLRGQRARGLLAALFIAGSTLSGALSIARETISDYPLFYESEVKLAAFVEENMDKDDMFLTGMHHANPIYTLNGRRVVCGPRLFLVWHGLDFAERAEAVETFYENPADNLDLLAEYDVRYIVLGWMEHGELTVDERALDALFEVVYDEEGTKVYQVPESLERLREKVKMKRPSVWNDNLFQTVDK